MYIASDVGLGIFRVNGIYGSFVHLYMTPYCVTDSAASPSKNVLEHQPTDAHYLS